MHASTQPKNIIIFPVCVTRSFRLSEPHTEKLIINLMTCCIRANVCPTIICPILCPICPILRPVVPELMLVPQLFFHLKIEETTQSPQNGHRSVLYLQNSSDPFRTWFSPSSTSIQLNVPTFQLLNRVREEDSQQMDSLSS